MLSRSVISFVAATAIMLSSLPVHADATLVVPKGPKGHFRGNLINGLF